MEVFVEVYDSCKYERDSKKVGEARYDIESFEVKQISDEEIYSMGFDEVDPYGEYLILTLAGGETSTFRNSFCDMFRDYVAEAEARRQEEAEGKPEICEPKKPGKKLVKADFEIRGHWTGSRVSGSAPYVYEVYIKGEMFSPISNGNWTSKARASSWLGKIVTAYNRGTLADENMELYERLTKTFNKK